MPAVISISEIFCLPGKFMPMFGQSQMDEGRKNEDHKDRLVAAFKFIF